MAPPRKSTKRCQQQNRWPRSNDRDDRSPRPRRVVLYFGRGCRSSLSRFVFTNRRSGRRGGLWSGIHGIRPVNNETQRIDTERAQRKIRIQPRSRETSAHTRTFKVKKSGCEQWAARATSIPSAHGRIFPENSGASGRHVVGTKSSPRAKMARAETHRPTNCRANRKHWLQDSGQFQLERHRHRSSCRSCSPGIHQNSPAARRPDTFPPPDSSGSPKKRWSFQRTMLLCTRRTP